eukprot:scaffold95280_cov32-Prasinocladus_malaysianus.AAC.1
MSHLSAGLEIGVRLLHAVSINRNNSEGVDRGIIACKSDSGPTSMAPAENGAAHGSRSDREPPVEDTALPTEEPPRSLAPTKGWGRVVHSN